MCGLRGRAGGGGCRLRGAGLQSLLSPHSGLAFGACWGRKAHTRLAPGPQGTQLRARTDSTTERQTVTQKCHSLDRSKGAQAAVWGEPREEPPASSGEAVTGTHVPKLTELNALQSHY